MEDNSQLLEMTADIVSAYVGNNNVQATEVPGLISSIHAALSQVSSQDCKASCNWPMLRRSMRR